MSEALWPEDAMFEHFTVFEETYKIVDSHEIKTAILIPKELKPGPHPILINVHGGFLVYGHSLFAPFFPPWALKLALEHSSIVVSPDHRLLPSANGVADVLEDLESFWQWTRSSLAGVLKDRAPSVSLDFSHLLVTGGSAGGYCATQLALSHPDEISAVALAYPFVDPKDPAVAEGPAPGDPSILRFKVEELPSKDSVVSWIEEARKTTTSKAGWDRTKLAVSAAQNGIFDSQIFDNLGLDLPDFLPLERIKRGAKLPKKVWILHGDDDSVVYLRATHRLVALAQEKLPETTIRLDVAKGEDHAFDLQKTSWELHAIGGLDFVKDGWLKN
ncbi:unnamed protein product [Clonostachys solani]|uniref:Alpha/beta hydrolase fold-3 domain-containing protein n=1 Tax=Clonostachys solani TaxID=160281 RepID=A0A9P0ENA8_9HYPO|nr:unnamed protein product [Clonostachys solani]